MKNNSGYIVQTKSGKRGRTYHSKGTINGKVPVYLLDDSEKPSETAMLCDPKTLKIDGFID